MLVCELGLNLVFWEFFRLGWVSVWGWLVLVSARLGCFVLSVEFVVLS